MGEIYGNIRKWYVDCPSGETKIFLIHGTGHFSDEYNVLGNFGDKYDKVKPTKDHGNHLIPKKN